MAITQIDMPFQQLVVVGADWRSLRDDQDIQWRVAKNHAIVIDMTIEQRNKLDGLEPWQYINIPTPDFQCPDWTAQQWLSLAAFVYNEGDHENKGCRVYVACQGGQGRTGIALAILRAIIAEDFANPVKAIRKFNPHFIETPGQEAYVKRIVKELDEMTKPVPVIGPIDWPVRAGKAEKLAGVLAGKIIQLEAEIEALKEERDEYRDQVYREQSEAEDRIAKKLHDALGIVFEDR